MKKKNPPTCNLDAWAVLKGLERQSFIHKVDI